MGKPQIQIKNTQFQAKNKKNKIRKSKQKLFFVWIVDLKLRNLANPNKKIANPNKNYLVFYHVFFYQNIK
jgi:hypothetical protein